MTKQIYFRVPGIPKIKKKHFCRFVAVGREENKVKMVQKPLSQTELKVFGRFSVAQTHFCRKNVLVITGLDRSCSLLLYLDIVSVCARLASPSLDLLHQ
jgi:hypothetical protein